MKKYRINFDTKLCLFNDKIEHDSLLLEYGFESTPTYTYFEKYKQNGCIIHLYWNENIKLCALEQGNSILLLHKNWDYEIIENRAEYEDPNITLAKMAGANVGARDGSLLGEVLGLIATSYYKGKLERSHDIFCKNFGFNIINPITKQFVKKFTMGTNIKEDFYNEVSNLAVDFITKMRDCKEKCNESI